MDPVRQAGPSKLKLLGAPLSVVIPSARRLTSENPDKHYDTDHGTEPSPFAGPTTWLTSSRISTKFL